MMQAPELRQYTGNKLALAFMLVTTLTVAACSDEAPTLTRPAPEVGIVVAEKAPAVNVVEFPGRVQAVRTAEVRARVNGIVERRLYEEGVDVVEGQKLFQIDPRELRAILNAVNATLARAEATVANAEQDVDRFKGLVADRAISEQEFDAAVARLRTAQADVAQVKAQRESAELNLGFATVTAPIAGRAGRAQVTEGALVSASAATLMTTIEQVDPVYVNFSRSSADMLRTRREITQGTLEVPELQRINVRLVLEDGSEYEHTGHLNFLSLSIDQDTGTAAIRAEFPNPDQSLVPGQFVRARIGAGVRPDAILIPQRAVQFAPQGASVMLVNPENVVEARNVVLGNLTEGAWRVTEGLSGGERVIVTGLQKIAVGQTVVPTPANLTADSPQ
ncbi:efflux RND transporter periplasmic adaptor subunit [Woeseia oceani]|nr:efflux RND transporter periplasmic adaptor subunit [Woeseia oceani]